MIDSFIRGDLGLFDWYLRYQQTPEFAVEVQQQYAREHRAEIRAQWRKCSQTYREHHPQAIKLRWQAQKHRETLFKQQKSVCFWCGEPMIGKYQVDHITPIIAGGRSEPKNLCVCHPECNHNKSATIRKRKNRHLYPRYLGKQQIPVSSDKVKLAEVMPHE